MGVYELFSDNADLSRLLEDNESLSISDAFHKAYIEIDEEGSEAATSSGMIL